MSSKLAPTFYQDVVFLGGKKQQKTEASTQQQRQWHLSNGDVLVTHTVQLITTLNPLTHFRNISVWESFHLQTSQTLHRKWKSFTCAHSGICINASRKTSLCCVRAWVFWYEMNWFKIRWMHMDIAALKVEASASSYSRGPSLVPPPNTLSKTSAWSLPPERQHQMPWDSGIPIKVNKNPVLLLFQLLVHSYKVKCAAWSTIKSTAACQINSLLTSSRGCRNSPDTSDKSLSPGFNIWLR